MALRVVAGTLSGRRLASPRGASTRPTSDRVREATFNSLVAHGFVQGATVVDLYAGSGAMGIEALSRGASSVTFVERSPQAAAVIRDNLASCGITGGATVVNGDVDAFLRSHRGRHDLALVDPPYDFDGWGDLLDVLDASVVVAESNRTVMPPERYGALGDGPYEVIRERRYGTTVVALAVARGREVHGTQPEDLQ